MGPRIGRWRALANVGFVLAVACLAGFGVVEVSKRRWGWQPTFTVRAEFANVGGLAEGDRVRLQGVDAGVVEEVMPPSIPGKPVRLALRVDGRLRRLVRADATAKIVTEGVVGAKVLEIVPGAPEAPPLPPSGLIASEPSVEMADLLKRATESLARIDAVASAAEEGLDQVNAIATAVRKGEGSLGKFVMEDEAYQKLVALSDKGEGALQDLEENLDALKRTWPLSRYFNGRSFFDRESLLFHPGSERDSRTLRAEDLFEPGRSVLTAKGRVRLDAVGAWFQSVKRPTSEIVIAAFTDLPTDETLAQILTQKQAEAVKAYLVSKYKIGTTGWFGSRKVAAVGFGTDAPRGAPMVTPSPPSRRIEVVVFTPQA
ncbi:MAG: MlaD family protein [Isosphaeraceae bacterium]